MLQEITLGIENLLLDPNNPRFVRDLTDVPEIPDEKVPDLQASILKKFDRNPSPSEDDDVGVTNISDLYASMRRIGFVGIDRIVVRTLADSGKYLVLEGNRRIATVKSILRDFDGNLPPLESASDREEVQAHLASLKTIPAMELQVDGLSKEDVAHRVAVILGIRHHGSLLGWDPLPRAYNIYTEYMAEQPVAKDFQYDQVKAKAVASRLCIQTGDVKKALRTYVAYLQVRGQYPEVRDDHFSLIEYNVIDKHLARWYYEIDDDTYQLSGKSLVKLNSVCQFSSRDSHNSERTTLNKKKILVDPKETKALSRLVRATREPHPAKKEYANDLLSRVEDEDDLEMTLDTAVNNLIVFEKRIGWITAIERLLANQSDRLKPAAYHGDGLDRGRKDELKETLNPIRIILGL